MQNLYKTYFKKDVDSRKNYSIDKIIVFLFTLTIFRQKFKDFMSRNMFNASDSPIKLRSTVFAKSGPMIWICRI